MTDESPQLTITLVGFNSNADLRVCLASLDSQLDPPSFEVIVVDNNSSDDTLAALERDRPDVTIIANERNVGFGTAHNQAARRARGEWLLLLNPDTVLPDRTLRMLFDARHDDLLLAPRLDFPDGSLQRSAHRRWPSWWSHTYLFNVFLFFALQRLRRGYDPTLYSNVQHTKPLAAKHVMGAVLFLRRDRFLALGGFDERYFLYLEETDLCRRFLDNGGDVHYRPEICVTHTLGGSSGAGKLGQGSPYFMDSSYRYLEGRYGRRGAAIVFHLTTAMLRINMPLLTVLRRASSDPRVALAADFNRDSLAWHRRQEQRACA